MLPGTSPSAPSGHRQDGGNFARSRHLPTLVMAAVRT